MEPVIAGQTCGIAYAAEKRDGSGVVATGTNVKLKVFNVNLGQYWTGSVWGAETELTMTPVAAGGWY